MVVWHRQGWIRLAIGCAQSLIAIRQIQSGADKPFVALLANQRHAGVELRANAVAAQGCARRDGDSA